MAYTFDPEKEKPTVLIEILPYRYVRINGKVHHLVKEVVLDPQGRRVRKFVPRDTGRVWVPPRIAKELTTVQSPGDRRVEGGPIARIIKTGEVGEAEDVEGKEAEVVEEATVEEAETSPKPPKPRRRRRAAVESAEA